MTDVVLNSELRDAPWLDPKTWRLPGVQPLNTRDWLFLDDAYSGQMRLRDKLIATREAEVHALLSEAREAAEECLALVLETLSSCSRFDFAGNRVIRPDGGTVALDYSQPLLTIGRLIQEDVCLMMQSDVGEHILAGAILCFPASWTLAEKLGKPLTRIHEPVRSYDKDIARRVQRMFNGIRPETPLWRANALLYDHPRLFSPMSEAGGPRHSSNESKFLRSERQTLRKLPVSSAVVFTIHTTVLPVENLTPEQLSALQLIVDRSS